MEPKWSIHPWDPSSWILDKTYDIDQQQLSNSQRTRIYNSLMRSTLEAYKIYKNVILLCHKNNYSYTVGKKFIPDMLNLIIDAPDSRFKRNNIILLKKLIDILKNEPLANFPNELKLYSTSSKDN